jgi:hypothetical protein
MWMPASHRPTNADISAGFVPKRRYLADPAQAYSMNAAAERVYQTVARGLVGEIARNFVIHHVVGDVDQDLIGLRAHA